MNEIQINQIREIFKEELLKILGDYSNIPLEIENALIARGFNKQLITGVTDTVYVAASSGASPTKAITFINGVRKT